MKRFIRAIHTAGNRVLHYAETLGTSRLPMPYRPIFIIGPPRSGSTLLYQALTEAYDVGYITNFHALFYGAPSFIERAVAPLRWRKQPATYESMHGTTAGWLEPSECGPYWYRFFRSRPQYVRLQDADEGAMHRMRTAVAKLTRAFGRPVLIKNMQCALRLEPIAHWIPEAIFIVTHRDVLANARSLLEVRRRVHGDYSTWWSMEPPDVEILRALQPHEQVVEQIRSIHRLIEDDSAAIGRHRFFHVDYERFCAEPSESLQNLEQWLSSLGVRLVRRAAIPSRFDRASHGNIDRDLDDRLVRYVGARQ